MEELQKLLWYAVYINHVF